MTEKEDLIVTFCIVCGKECGAYDPEYEVGDRNMCDFHERLINELVRDGKINKFPSETPNWLGILKEYEANLCQS